MSRIGKKPIPLPKGVTVTVNGLHLLVQGPKGKLERDLPPRVSVAVQDGHVHVTRASEDRIAREMHGLARTLVANMVKGVVEPYKASLEVTGIGYKAELAGQTLKIQCGYSHTVVHPVPPGVSVKLEGVSLIHLESADKELIGHTAASIRAYKICDPYKAKGIKYKDEVIKRKEGKTGAG
ncbi:MAG: 50S ribosomal protein L6 [Deltaproteobacteria bacterium]|nr:50S ribosomal protein L6 [Deltaproteobacteria bacterium]